MEWSDFYVTNAVVIALGIAQAHLAPLLPLAPLTFASLMLINAVFFHILPFARTRGRRFSPGLVTAILLFFPIGIALWWKAGDEALLDRTTVMAAIAGGAALMAYPIVMLNLRGRPYFRQS